MSIRFMPEASLASIEQYRPARSDVTKELTRDIRSHASYAAGSRRAMRAICPARVRRPYLNGKYQKRQRSYTLHRFLVFCVTNSNMCLTRCVSQDQSERCCDEDIEILVLSLLKTTCVGHVCYFYARMI